MRYDDLVTALYGFGGRACIRAGGDIRVQAAQLFDTLYDVGGETYYNRDFLFVGSVSDLPPDPEKGPRDAVCIEDVPVPEAYLTSAVTNLILTDRGSDLIQLSTAWPSTWRTTSAF